MNRADKFAMVVQMGLLSLIRMTSEPEMHDPMGVMGLALKLPEEAIPEDFERAARDFLHWAVVNGCDEEDEPEWYAAWRETWDGS